MNTINYNVRIENEKFGVLLNTIQVILEND